MNTAIHWSGPVLVLGALAFGLMIALISRQPVIGMSMTPDFAALALSSTALLLLSLPAVYAVQADSAGALGLVGHALLATGLLLVIVVAATPILHPTLNAPTGEHPLLFALGIALVLGLLLTAIATFQADVFPRPAALVLLAATVGFFFVFFVAEFLPPIAGQIGSMLFGGLLAIAFAWMGVALWLSVGALHLLPRRGTFRRAITRHTGDRGSRWSCPIAESSPTRFGTACSPNCHGSFAA